MVAAVDEIIEFWSAVEHLPHPIRFSASLQFFTCLPAFASGDFVRLHLESVLFDSPENVETPVIPHGWPCLDDVVGLWVEPRQVLDWAVKVPLMSVFLNILLLLADRGWGRVIVYAASVR